MQVLMSTIPASFHLQLDDALPPSSPSHPRVAASRHAATAGGKVREERVLFLDIGGLIETRLQALCFGLEDAWQEPEP